MNNDTPYWSLTMTIAWISTGDMGEVLRWSHHSPEMSHAVQILDDEASIAWQKLRGCLAKGDITAVASKNSQPLALMADLDWALGSYSFEADFSLTWTNRTGDSFREIHVSATDVQRLFGHNGHRPILKIVASGMGQSRIGAANREPVNTRIPKAPSKRRGAKPKPIWGAVNEFVLELRQENGPLGEDQPGWKNQAAVEAHVSRFIESRGYSASESTVRSRTASALQAAEDAIKAGNL